MLVIKSFSVRKKVFRERKKTEKIRAKRTNDERFQATMKKLRMKVYLIQRRGEEDEKELVEMGEVGKGPFGEGEGGTAVAGVDRDMDAKKEKTRRIS
nr:hypothetical protein [Tanacetum cinerariifolium]